MKKFRKIILFMIIAYISCVIVKVIINKFSCNVEILIDSIFNSLGVTLGWYGYDWIHEKVINKKNK